MPEPRKGTSTHHQIEICSALEDSRPTPKTLLICMYTPYSPLCWVIRNSRVHACRPPRVHCGDSCAVGRETWDSGFPFRIPIPKLQVQCSHVEPSVHQTVILTYCININLQRCVHFPLALLLFWVWAGCFTQTLARTLYTRYYAFVSIFALD